MDPRLTLTVDELSALHRAIGLTLPRFVVESDSAEVAADVAALRGLAARDLVELRGVPSGDPDVRLSERLAGHLAPCAAATLIAELDLEGGSPNVAGPEPDDGSPEGDSPAGGAPDGDSLNGMSPDGAGVAADTGELIRCALLGEVPGDRATPNRRTSSTTTSPAGGGGSGLIMTLTSGGLVSLVPDDTPVAESVAWLSGVRRLAESPTGEGFTVDAEAHAAADELALAGDPAAAVRTLIGAGVPEHTARDWIETVRRRRGATAVTVSHTVRGQTRVAELRWLTGHDGTAWRVTGELAPAGSGGGWRDEEPREVSVVGPVPGGALRAALADLFTVEDEVRTP